MEKAVIISACRTAIGEYLGSLSTFKATQLGSIVIREAVKRAGVSPEEIEEVIMGQVVQGGSGQAPARQAAINAGINPGAGAMTVNKVCGSGLKAVVLAAQSIILGENRFVVAGGMESMSTSPYGLEQARTGYRMGHSELIDFMIKDGLWCPFENQHMGMAAEYIAQKHNITRQMMDEYSYNSHKKAINAIDNGYFKNEIVPVEIPQKKGEPVIYETDERPRRDINMESLSKLRPAFKKDGMVTAGNAPGLNDGAAALVLTSESIAKATGLKPIAKINGWATGGTKPLELFEAPVVGTEKLMKKLNRKIDDYELIEANEAFAAQALVDGKMLGWDWEKVNIHGGAIALGHPIGASGARILVTLLYAMKKYGKTLGLATLCLGGGNAVSVEVEMV